MQPRSWLVALCSGWPYVLLLLASAALVVWHSGVVWSYWVLLLVLAYALQRLAILTQRETIRLARSDWEVEVWNRCKKSPDAIPYWQSRIVESETPDAS